MVTATRKSKKREAIWAALAASKAHPSAEQLYSALKEDIPDLSLGTVYRNLARFREEGSAMCVATVNGQDRFDGCTLPHAHFICRSCGEVEDIEGIDVPIPDIEGSVEGYQLQYTGLCRACEETLVQ